MTTTACAPFMAALAARLSALLAALVVVAAAAPAWATSGPGCLVVIGVAPDDPLNLRAKPDAGAPVVDVLPLGRHGILHQDGPCVPRSAAPGSRWCPVTHYNGDRTTHGWLKARYVRPSDCP